MCGGVLTLQQKRKLSFSLTVIYYCYYVLSYLKTPRRIYLNLHTAPQESKGLRNVSHEYIYSWILCEDCIRAIDTYLPSKTRKPFLIYPRNVSIDPWHSARVLSIIFAHRLPPFVSPIMFPSVVPIYYFKKKLKI